VFLPETVLAEPDELRGWIRKSLDFTANLPAKKKRPAPKPAAKGSPREERPRQEACHQEGRGSVQTVIVGSAEDGSSGGSGKSLEDSGSRVASSSPVS
jgi:hypothetical protein